MLLPAALDRLASHRAILFGGKGGVGKTTISAAAALHFARRRAVVLFTTDPASNLDDLLGDATVENLTIEALDAEALYRQFLDRNLAAFLELGDRGTYLDRDELTRFFELSLPGVDELMAWTRIGELLEEDADRLVIVDTAPTGHTLRMLGAAEHFRQFALALDAMQEKHRGMVRQFTRRDVRDAMDEFIEAFDAQAAQRRALLSDPDRAAFVPVLLSEPWVVEQTLRLITEVREDGLHVPFAVLNRAAPHEDDGRCRAVAARDAEAIDALAPLAVAVAPHACEPMDSAVSIGAWMDGRFSHERARSFADYGVQRDSRVGAQDDKARAGTSAEVAAADASSLHLARLTFLAGKGGVGKTTSSASIALQLALRHPEQRFTVISVDPAHSLRDVFAHESPPPNLAVEMIDTRAKWRRFRDTLGVEIERAVDSLTPGGMTVAYDTEAVKKLIEIAPPGADELFAIKRIADLLADETQAAIVVDTAPTGHFLRLLDLPRTAGEWVREFMRILLHYRELIAPGSLGEELVSASRALKELSAVLTSDRASVIVVTRPERIVLAETSRLIADLDRRGIALGGVIANYMTPQSNCACDQSLRASEAATLATLGRDVVRVERRDAPVTRLEELATLVPLG